MIEPLLSVRGVHASYGDVLALDDVSLDIRHNEFFALLGPSGCGKTTLLRAIAGFETPTAGRIELEGKDLRGLPPNRRPLNMMFQSYALFPHLSVERNIAYGLEAERLPPATVRERVGEVMEVVGLTEYAKRRPAQLSGGQRQRVALARAIVKRPRLLLLDEPLSALDRQVRAAMQLELKRLQHDVGLTFVVVTHDQEEAMSMADRVAVLRAGRLEQLASPHELYARPATRFVASFVGTANLFDGTASVNGVDIPGIGEVRAEHDLAAGSPATAVVRPEEVLITAAGEGVPATVQERSFHGASTTTVLKVPGLNRPVLAASQGASFHQRDEQVGVRFARASVVRAPQEPS